MTAVARGPQSLTVSEMNYRFLAAARLGMTIAFAACGRAPATTPVPDPLRISVVPAPVSVSRGNGVFTLDSTSVILVEGDSAMRVAEMLGTQLRAPTGFRLPVGGVSGPTLRGGIRLRLDAG